MFLHLLENSIFFLILLHYIFTRSDWFWRLESTICVKDMNTTRVISYVGSRKQKLMIKVLLWVQNYRRFFYQTLGIYLFQEPADDKTLFPVVKWLAFATNIGLIEKQSLCSSSFSLKMALNLYRVSSIDVETPCSWNNT